MGQKAHKLLNVIVKYEELNKGRYQVIEKRPIGIL